MSSSATPTAPVTPEILAAIRDVVNYNWADEQADYKQQDHQDRERHIFRSLRVVSNWLPGSGRQGEQARLGERRSAELHERYRGTIEWDIDDADNPAEAAATMWRYICESEGPFVAITDRDTGEVHGVDLYKL